MILVSIDLQQVLTRQCDVSLIEELCALLELRFIVFLHIMNRSVHIENTRLYRLVEKF